MDHDLDTYLAFADTLADAARAVIRPYFRTALAIDDKPAGPGSEQPVTRADRESEEAMRALIRATFPDHGILGEELGQENPDAPYCWVLDPIDGTRAFIAGFTTFGTLIALSYRDQPIVGIMDQPILEERFVGSAKGTFLNGRQIRTRPCPKLEDAVYALTDPRMLQTAAQRAAYERILTETRFPQFGGNCYAYAMVAAGAIDIVTEGDLKPWDTHALVPIIEGAGGVMTAWDGGPGAGAGWAVACGDPAVHAQILPWLQGATGAAEAD